VLHLTDGDGHINEIGNSIDFLVDNGRMPSLIVVGIANTDRTRDLTPTHADAKDSAGKETLPTSGGGDRFFDFIHPSSCLKSKGVTALPPTASSPDTPSAASWLSTF
jgi:predicted alpha/beta superfamily hydrolase